jgi:hypothetical protein
LAEVDGRVRHDLDRNGLVRDLGPDAVFQRLDSALAALGGRPPATETP